VILGRHNAHLTAIKDEDAADKWTGDAEAFWNETLANQEAEQADVWGSSLLVPSNLPVEVEAGDSVVFTCDGTTYTREVRDLVKRPLFGVYRLLFSDR
jgi:hypothetical protein